ncbi:hypothetical protein Slu03_12710 [Sediminihabitans luteus]|nr:hypothetical protein Slu03_12710 [Sediminihabitans luteus]
MGPVGPGAADGGERPLLHDSRRPPAWLPRSLFIGAIAVFLAIFAWTALGQLNGLIVNLLIAFFISLMLEPMVVWLVRRRWRRGAATGVVFVGSILAACAVIALFGNLFVQQLVQLIKSVPDLYADVATWAHDSFELDLPPSDELLKRALGQYGDDLAGILAGIGTSVLGVFFSALTIGLVTYYLMAAGPRFRSSICSWLTPRRQTEVLRLWEITQIKVSDFISSRVVLAMFCSVATSIFLFVIDTPYALPLGLFTGVVSQFVPTIGTYIGGALPVAIALTSQGTTEALLVLGFILVYQQVENYLISPRITARALSMNPAVSFVSVLAFGAVFGALGAFLALPVVATFQAAANTWFTRHDLVESHMLHDPGEEGGEPLRKDTEGAEGTDERGAAAAARAAAAKDAEDAARAGDGHGLLFRGRSASEKRRQRNIRAAQDAAAEADRRRRDEAG